MDRYENVTLMNMCLVYDDKGNVLVQDRVDPNWSGITLPGGHVEKNESFTDSVIREIYEETGLTISHPVLCGIKDWYDEHQRYMVLCYKTNSFSGELVSSDEGKVFWVKKESIPTLNLASGMDSTLEVFFNPLVSECFFHEVDGRPVDELK